MLTGVAVDQEIDDEADHLTDGGGDLVIEVVTEEGEIRTKTSSKAVYQRVCL